jgi:hypothetical protein
MGNREVLTAKSTALTAERIFSPVSVQQFLGDYWGRRHLVVHRGDREYFERLFSFADVDRYLAITAKSGDAWLSVGQGGKVARRIRTQDVDVRDLYAAVHGGSTILLESTDRWWAPTAELASELGHALSARVKVNVYITPPGQQGAPIHPDVQDVFVLQMEGAKEWHIYEDRVYEAVETLEHIDGFGYTRPALPGEPTLALRTVLETGDLLYLPRGVLHRAVAPPDRPSLHLTVCATPVYWVDFLKVAVEALSLEHPELAGALAPGFERDPAVRDRLRAEFGSLLRLVADHASFDRAADVYALARTRAEANPADGHFEQLLRLDEITADTLVERRRGRPLRVEAAGDAVRLHFGASHIQAAAALTPVFEFIRDHPRFRAGELPGSMSGQSRQVLVQRLVREGLLRACFDEEAR